MARGSPGDGVLTVTSALFWSAMIALAMCSLRSRTAVRLTSSALRRSFASSLGLRPVFRGSRPAAPDALSCARHVDSIELKMPSSRSIPSTAPS